MPSWTAPNQHWNRHRTCQEEEDFQLRRDGLGENKSNSITEEALLTCTRLSCVSGEALFAFANKMTRQIATLRVLGTKSCQGWNFAFIDIMAWEAIAVITGKAWTIETAHGIGAMSKHVAWSVLAFVLVWKVATFATEAVIAIAKVVQTHTVKTFWHLWMAVICGRGREVS